MAEFIFDGKEIVEPGFYSEVRSGVVNPPIALPYGNVLIIDKDATSFHGNGASIAGQLQEGKAAIKSFGTIPSLRRHLGGGVFWDLAQPLFRPFGSGSSGASRVYYIRALTTTAAQLTITFDTEDTLTLRVKNEGLSGNGVLTSDTLTRGYGVTLTAGVNDPSKFVFRAWRGTFTGIDPVTQNPYDNIPEEDTVPELLARSPEVAKIEELILWMNTDSRFLDNFQIVSGDSSTGDLVSDDIIAIPALFAGGTSVYATARINEVLTAIKGMNINYILTTDIGSDATSVDNTKIATFLDTEMPYPATLVIGGGETRATFITQSIAAAAYYNSQNVNIIHSGCSLRDVKSPTGLRDKNVLYKAALYIGREAGLPPQTPMTYKGLDIAADKHELDDDERKAAIRGGVISTVWDDALNMFRVLQGVNTIQDNKFVVNSQGTSPSTSVVRIIKQLLKEMALNAVVDLLGDQQVGPNRATLDPDTVRAWVVGFLKRREATSTEDNLIIDSSDVVVLPEQDAYRVTFAFTPNYEVNKIFVTATIIDSAAQ